MTLNLRYAPPRLVIHFQSPRVTGTVRLVAFNSASDNLTELGQKAFSLSENV